MNEAIIMKLDDQTELIGKEGPVRGIEPHPVVFPHYESFTCDRQNIVEKIKAALVKYRDRSILVTYANYGLEASVNYQDGKFRSLILKGSGEAGERIADQVALRFVPSDIPNHGKLTLHVLLTIRDEKQFRGKRTPPWTVPNLMRRYLRLDKQPRYTSQSVVCRVERLYRDGVQVDVDDILDDVDQRLTTEYSYMACYETLPAAVYEFIRENDTYMLPMCGVVISDEFPNDPGAFPSMHFLLDEFVRPWAK